MFDLPDNIEQHIFPVTESGCWVWMGRVKPDGYAVDSAGLSMHRKVYTLLAGAIPDGLVLDHKCRVRCCVNPAHLEAVTRRENVRRGGRAQKTMCVRGHTLSDAIITKDGFRRCRHCPRLRP